MYLSGDFIAVKKSRRNRKTQLVVNSRTGAIYNKSKKTLNFKKVDTVKINTVALGVLNSKIGTLNKLQLETLLTLQKSSNVQVVTLKTARKIDVKAINDRLSKK